MPPQGTPVDFAALFCFLFAFVFAWSTQLSATLLLLIESREKKGGGGQSRKKKIKKFPGYVTHKEAHKKKLKKLDSRAEVDELLSTCQQTNTIDCE